MTTADKTKPFYSPVDWNGMETQWPTVALRGDGKVTVWDGKRGSDSMFVEVDPRDRLALATLALYGQSFGFTQEDVQALSDAISTQGTLDDVTGFALISLRDRIAHLLPTATHKPPSPSLAGDRQ